MPQLGQKFRVIAKLYALQISNSSWGMRSMVCDTAAGHVVPTPLVWGFQIGFLCIRWTLVESAPQWK